MEQTRRDFLKKSAVAGGIVWASPVLTSLPAHAQTGGTPCPEPCTGGARGGFVSTALGDFEFGVDNDPADTGENCFIAIPGDPIVNSGTLCGEFANCDASAHVENVSVLEGLITATAVSSNASGANGCPTGDANILNLVVAGTPITIDQSPNSTTTVGTPLGTATVVLNEQTCDPGDPADPDAPPAGEFTVRAVHITITDALGTLVSEVILAESRVANPCCPTCPA